MKRLTEWIEKHLFLVWIISSGLFAFIIHCLFSIIAPNEWLTAKWGAGDILTFASTIALGLLAVWQNKKFKEENDLSQTRMENLTKKANELAAVSKIIEHESESVSRLRTKSQNFIDACNTEAILVDISDIAHQPDDFKKLYVKIKMDNRSKQIRLCAIELLSELKTYLDSTELINLISLISQYSEQSIELVKEVRAGAPLDDTYKKKADAEKEFIKNISDFISNRKILLNKVIFEDLTIEKIKAMYRGTLNKDDKNEQQRGTSYKSCAL